MNNQTILQGMQALSCVDQEIKQAFLEIGTPQPRTRTGGFAALLAIIVSQQLSTKVADVIMARVVALLGEVTPQRVMDIGKQALRNAGLSWRKVEYAKGLAEAVVNGSFDIEGLENLTDEQAIKEITNLKGFGRWSAECYLLFSQARQDIFPADDLGLLVALAKLKGLPEKPTAKQAREMVNEWQPWRSVGALFLWHYYQHISAQK